MMDLQALKRTLARPEIHEKILSGYSGEYSLGIGLDPKQRHLHVVVLQLGNSQGQEAFRFPPAITLGDESVPVVIRSFRTPRPLTTR